MAAPDRSWTVGPTLLWFSGCLIVALCVLDGGVSAVADRFTARRAPAAPPAAGPAFAAKPAEVADAEADAEDDKAAAPAPLVPTDRGKILALEDTCLDGTAAACKRWAMDGFYRAVGEAKQGKLGRAVRVSWYGDSVIATDAIPGRLRTLLQGELGDGGPGFVYVVPPHRFCGHEAITRSSGGSWIAHAISTTQTADGLYGVGGSTAETDDGRATIKLTAGTASQVELYYLAQPHGGTATIAADGATIATVATKHETKQAGYAAAQVEGGAKKFELTTSGRVRVFGLDLENPTGAVVDNLGVVSVNVKSFDANNPAHFTAELAHRSADLVMIMIGANEAQWLGPTDKDTRDYAAHYTKLLAEVRGARPDAACLVVSPTDQAEAKDGDYPSRPVMPVLIAAQRGAALAQGCAFYSTYEWMGGKGSAAKWFRKGLVGTDFQHLSRKGANKLSESLFGALMAGYQSYAH
ncbi:MAG: GDSL-type esterase/lipase family protein [Kofleriaceae bacterium]